MQAEGRLSCLQGALHLVTKLQARQVLAVAAHFHVSMPTSTRKKGRAI